MEFGMEKCVMLTVKYGKRETTERMEIPNQENIRKFKTQTNGPKDKDIGDSVHSRDYIHRLHVSRKEGERGLRNIEDHVITSIQGLDDSIEESKERIITAASNSNNNFRTNRKITKMIWRG